MKFIFIFILLGISNVSSASLCTKANFKLVGRVLFGEARGETATGQLAVAYSIVNRVRHSAFPNTLNKVVYQKTRSHYQYETLGLLSHDKQWENAKRSKTTEYKNSISIAKDALCGIKSDPMKCGPVFFCAIDPCAATNGNKWHPVTKKMKIGNHWFACIQ